MGTIAGGRWLAMAMNRREIIAQCIHSAEMEGGVISDEFRRDAEAYAQGRISSDELFNRTWKRHYKGSATVS